MATISASSSPPCVTRSMTAAVKAFVTSKDPPALGGPLIRTVETWARSAAKGAAEELAAGAVGELVDDLDLGGHL